MKHNLFICMDCKVNTLDIDEYYMIHNRLWKSIAKEKGMLCIGCLEKRLGRLLTKEDFPNCEINYTSHPSNRMSERLINRLTN